MPKNILIFRYFRVGVGRAGAANVKLAPRIYFWNKLFFAIAAVRGTERVALKKYPTVTSPKAKNDIIWPSFAHYWPQIRIL